MKSFYDDGLHFTCTQCGHCCADEPGYVFLSEKEISQIASFLELSRPGFLSDYCRTMPMGSFSLISLLEKKNNDCIFFTSDKSCAIYSVRPVQCRSYPFWEKVVETDESWHKESLECQGINSGRLHTKEEIEHWIRMRRNNQPIMVT